MQNRRNLWLQLFVLAVLSCYVTAAPVTLKVVSLQPTKSTDAYTGRDATGNSVELAVQAAKDYGLLTSHLKLS